MGKLIISLVQGAGLRKFLTEGRPNPYVVISVGELKYLGDFRLNVRSKTVTKARTPFWNETFEFSVSPDKDQIEVKVMSYNPFGKDDMIGEPVTYTLNKLYMGFPSHKWFELRKNGILCGEVMVTFNATDFGAIKSPDEHRHFSVPLKEDKPKDKPKEDKPKEDKPKEDKPKDKPKEDKPKEDKPKEDKPKEDKPKEDKPKEDKPKEDKPKEDKSKEDKPKEDRPKEDKPKEDKPKEDKPKEDKPKEDKPKEDKSKEDEEKPKEKRHKEKKHKEKKSKDSQPN